MMASSTQCRLEQHQAELIARIAAAAKASDAERILALTDELSRTAGLLARLSTLDVEAESLFGRPPSIEGNSLPSAVQFDAEVVPGREHGVAIRREFLQRAAQAGLPLRPYRGAIFMSPKGRRIGVAVATERKPNRWFLGLGEKLFDAAVLLCKTESGKVIDICLPAAFFAQFGRFLSRSGDQVKFNVALRDTHMIVKIPGRAPERVDALVGAIAGLER